MVLKFTNNGDILFHCLLYHKMMYREISKFNQTVLVWWENVLPTKRKEFISIEWKPLNFYLDLCLFVFISNNVPFHSILNFFSHDPLFFRGQVFTAFVTNILIPERWWLTEKTSAWLWYHFLQKSKNSVQVKKRITFPVCTEVW